MYIGHRYDISDHFPVVYINGESENCEVEAIQMKRIYSSENKCYFMKLFLIWIGARDTKLLTLRRHLQNFVLNQSQNTINILLNNQSASNISLKSPGFQMDWEGPFLLKISYAEKV